MTKANAKTADHKAKSSAHNRRARKPKSTTPRKTKATLVREMLERKSGASVDKLCNATSWQPHTVRAALSGPCKAGHALDRTKDGDGTSACRITLVDEAQL